MSLLKVSSLLKSLLCGVTQAQNTPVEYWRRYQTSGNTNNDIFFGGFFLLAGGRGGGKFFKVHSMSILAICSNQRKETVPIAKLLRINKTGLLLACIANVSHVFGWFRSKKDRGTGFSVLAAREMKREPKKWKRGEGEGKVGFSLPHPLPALLLAPFFARSLTLVPRSLTLNHTETLATQARPLLEWKWREDTSWCLKKIVTRVTRPC